MARHKKKEKDLSLMNNHQETPAEIPPEEKVLALTGAQLMRLKLHECEAKLAFAEARWNRVVRENFLRQIDPEGQLQKLQVKIDEFNRAEELARSRYREVLVEIEKELGISMKSYSYDDETGVLHQLA